MVASSTTTAPSPRGPIEALRLGVALADQLTLAQDMSVHVDHHVHAGAHDVTVTLFARSAMAARRAMQSPAFAGSAWDFSRYRDDHWSTGTHVGPVRVTVHGGRP